MNQDQHEGQKSSPKNYRERDRRREPSSFDPVDMQDRQRRYYNDEYTGQQYFDDNYEPRNARRDERSFSRRQQRSENNSSGYGEHQYGPQPNYERDGGYQSYRGGYGNSADQGGYPISQGTGFQSGDFNHGGGLYGDYRHVEGRREPRGPKGYQRSDERLTDDVCERLSHGEVNAEDIEVKVSQGVVTLVGTVTSRYEKRLAEDLIENIFGVKDVINHLRVAGGASDNTPNHPNAGKFREL